ncbi:MAG TPA: BamA/TamA family outer membrane protein [Longimicrobium sp.]|uniref:BamA/TamA family outer membrane protein n=1 Tax=Longimicrobium sp. TaxID=2029185 RepID=UPI002EDB3A8B
MPRFRTALAVRLAAAALAVLAPRAGAAQARSCPDGAISEVFIDPSDIFEVGSEELDPRFNWAYRAANRLHPKTNEGVIRSELLVKAGDCYDRARLEDSERTLRNLSFLAEADVFGVRQADGSWHVVVKTRDEWSMRLEPQVGDEGVGLSGVEFREDNLFGSGNYLSAFAKEYQGERVYGGTAGTRQLLWTDLDAEIGLQRTPVGHAYSQRLSDPFRGESDRWAFREQVEGGERNFTYFVRDEDGRLRRTYFEERRRAFDVGAVFRVGPRGNLTLFGLALAGDWTEYPRGTLSGDGDGDEPLALGDAPAPVTGLDTLSSIRVVFLAGQRNVRFVRRRSLDAVHGSEDVRLGVEIEAGVGRSLPSFSTDDDLSLTLGFSTAAYLSPRMLAGVRATAEGRRLYGAESGQEWRNLFGQFDAWAYYRPSDESRHTWVAAGTVVGGWRTRVPFQLTLGNRTGVRGLPPHAFSGERRAVGTLEHRMYLGWPYPRLFDIGSAAFVDVGRVWAGGDPFSRTSPVAVTAGMGLRAAFPPGSRRTYRLDFAYPLTGGVEGRGVQVIFGIGQAVGRTANEDAQLRRSSRRALSASLFSFPD